MMMKIASKVLALSAVATTVLLGSGWRIPEQSATSVALSGAYVASAQGAQSSYYNPANMSFNKNRYQTEVDLTYIHLGSVHYKDNLDRNKNGRSKLENFYIPTFFLTSQDYSGFHFGMSLTAPGGLSKRWGTPLQKAFAQEFTLQILEFNPTISYKILSNLSVAGGVRLIYSSGVVKSNAQTIARDLDGDVFATGYNLAMAYKIDKNSNFSVTYRSKVDLKEEGNAKLYVGGHKVYDGGASVQVPLPAVLNAALKYTFNKKTTLELVYDRTFWSEYKSLDFQYKTPIYPALRPYFDDPKAKNWEDSDAIRIGLTHKIDSYDLMAGFAYDTNPIPKGKVAFELPDSDSYLFSVGSKYTLDDKQSITIGYLYDMKKDRKDTNVEAGVNGKFTDSTAHLISLGYSYDF